MQIMPLDKVVVAVAIMAAITFFTRAFPFLFFGRKEPSKTLLFIGEYIPPVIISILVVYCLKDTNLFAGAHGLNELAGVLLVVTLHLWKSNALISIFGGTALYMVLVQTRMLELLI